VVLDEGDLDAELGQRVVEQVVAAAVERGALTMWLPASARLRMASVSAAWPLATASAPMPPSSAAIRCSSTSCVGFMIRV
jgi:hypothetical protein